MGKVAPTASERGAESKVAHKWARWLPPLQSGGQNQKWPTSGQGGYITPAASGVPTASERWAESEVAQRWLQACIFSKIGNSFFVVRSYIFFILVVNACRKKSSHRAIFFLR